ncbi:MAG: polysaccharide deacetylase family protein [Bacteroidales bacterium]|nr:polysaccharide deacetylase family protein [Bacteroidales bacterium]
MIPGSARFPGLIRLLYRDAIYRVKGVERKLYITFDDGPTDQGTAKIVDVLKKNEVEKAVFFCTGSNIKKYPDSTRMIAENGYSIANHGYKHLDGWKSRRNDYIENCLQGSELSGSIFYRPPYGHLTIPQYRAIKKYMRIVFWDLLLYDFDTNLQKEYVLNKAGKLVRQGSVIVLHDKENMCALRVLDGLISLCINRGYEFGDLTKDL